MGKVLSMTGFPNFSRRHKPCATTIIKTTAKLPTQKLATTTLSASARAHAYLKNVDLDIPRHKLVVVTGLSGSGKSSLAFDTLYAEGQRRYVESLSAYARQFLQMMDKPDVDLIEACRPRFPLSRNPPATIRVPPSAR